MRLTVSIAAIICGSVAAAAPAQVIDIEAVFSGEVNGGMVEASGGGQIDVSGQGGGNADLVFASIPNTFDPLAASLLSNLCSNTFRADGSSQNLWDLSQGQYSVSRVFQWVGIEGSAVTIDSEVTRDDPARGEGQGRIVSTSSISGTYSGPTDLVGINSYSVTWLPGSTPGEVFEAGTVVLERANGESLIMLFASVFSGLDGSLDRPQSGSAEFETTVGPGTLGVSWRGEFSVVPNGSTALLMLSGLAVAGRRRR